MVGDLVGFGVANRAVGMSLSILALLFLGLIVVAAKLTAPFIYTLF